MQLDDDLQLRPKPDTIATVSNPVASPPLSYLLIRRHHLGL